MNARSAVAGIVGLRGGVGPLVTIAGADASVGPVTHETAEQELPDAERVGRFGKRIPPTALALPRAICVRRAEARHLPRIREARPLP